MSGEEFYGPGYEDSSRLPPNITKLRSLGWTPQYDVRATFRDAMAYYLRGRRPSGNGAGARRDRRLIEAGAAPGTAPKDEEGLG
jgi:hypothetical protein